MSADKVDNYLLRLDGLMREGRELRARLANERSGGSSDAARAWQQQCAGIVNELSGGSKAHWLARAFSEAFLVRSVAGKAVEEAPVTEIVDRVLGVLGQAGQSLARIDKEPAVSAAAAPRPHRFDFVHNVALRPILEQADVNGGTALEQGRLAEALMTTCGVLEAVITDALEHLGRNPHQWSFEARIDAAEKAGLIRGGCARLPPVALRYRELTDADGEPHRHVTVTARDARVTSQVLQVVMRDLDPGR